MNNKKYVNSSNSSANEIKISSSISSLDISSVLKMRDSASSLVKWYNQTKSNSENISEDEGNTSFISHYTNKTQSTNPNINPQSTDLKKISMNDLSSVDSDIGLKKLQISNVKDKPSYNLSDINISNIKDKPSYNLSDINISNVKDKPSYNLSDINISNVNVNDTINSKKNIDIAKITDDSKIENTLIKMNSAELLIDKLSQQTNENNMKLLDMINVTHIDNNIESIKKCFDTILEDGIANESGELEIQNMIKSSVRNIAITNVISEINKNIFNKHLKIAEKVSNDNKGSITENVPQLERVGKLKSIDSKTIENIPNKIHSKHIQEDICQYNKNLGVCKSEECKHIDSVAIKIDECRNIQNTKIESHQKESNASENLEKDIVIYVGSGKKDEPLQVCSTNNGNKKYSLLSKITLFITMLLIFCICVYTYMKTKSAKSVYNIY